MLSSQWWFTVLVLLVGIERLVELVLARRHERWLLQRGAVEYGASHYPFMVALHTGLLVGCLVEVWVADPQFLPVIGWTMFVLVVAAQALRWWCIRTLGQRWTTRVFVVPGLQLVSGGPYRFLNHPNYVAVAVEGAALPLVHSAWITAVVFTVLNGALMLVRIRTESGALAMAATAVA